MPLDKCECINTHDRRNMLFLLKSKIDELNGTLIDIEKKIQSSNFEKTKWMIDNKIKITTMRDSLSSTRIRIIDTPICE